MRFRLPGRSRLSLAQVHRDTVVSVFGSFAAQAMVLVSGVLVARMLGVENRGHLALLWLVALILGQLGMLGLPLAITYWIAKDPRSARAIMRSLLGPAVVQGPLLVALQAGALLLLVGNEAGPVRLAAVLTLPLIPAMIAQQYALGILQGQRRFRAFNLLRTLPSTLYALAVAALFLLSAGDLPAVALAFTSVYVFAGGGAIWYAVAGLPRPSTHGGAVPSRGEMVRFGLKGMVGSISPLDTFQLDQAVVGLFISPAALGFYVVGLAFSNLPRFVAQSIGFVAFPHVAAHTDSAHARRAMWRFAALALAACGSIVGVLEATAGWLVPLFFGDQFSPAIDLARILLVSALLVGLRRVLADGARGAGHPTSGTVAEVVAWASLFPSLAILVPAAGAKGVAVALAVSALVGMVTLVVSVMISGRRAPPPPVGPEPSPGLAGQMTP